MSRDGESGGENTGGGENTNDCGDGGGENTPPRENPPAVEEVNESRRIGSRYNERVETNEFVPPLVIFGASGGLNTEVRPSGKSEDMYEDLDLGGGVTMKQRTVMGGSSNR